MTFNRFKFACTQGRLIFKRAFSLNVNHVPKDFKIEMPYGPLAVKVWNESGNKTPIIALHGWMDNAGSFDKLCPLLDKQYPVFAFDLPGHGYSARPRLGFGTYFMDYVVTLHKILHHFQWKQVILMGHSMGGDISLMYAGIMPDVVEKLIALDTIVPVYVESQDQPNRTAQSFSALLSAEQKLISEPPRYKYDEIVRRIIEGYMQSVNEDSAKTLLLRNSRKHEDGKYSFTFSPYLKVNNTISLTVEQLKSFLSGIICDLLIVRAVDSVRYVKAEVARELVDSYKKTSKNFVLEVVEGTHHVHMNNPEPIASLINDFLQGVPQSDASKSKSEEFVQSEKL